MSFLNGLIRNPVFVAAVMGWFVAQVLKTMIHFLIHKEFIWERMVGSGGMPSSHSATVCALTKAVGIQYGSGGFEFAIAVIVAIIVMANSSASPTVLRGGSTPRHSSMPRILGSGVSRTQHQFQNHQ